MPDDVSFTVGSDVTGAEEGFGKLPPLADDVAKQMESDFARLSQALDSGTDTSVAKASLSALNEMFKSGAIDADQYGSAVSQIQIDSGLASEASQAAADALLRLNQQFADGQINSNDYAAGVKAIQDSLGAVQPEAEKTVLSFTEINQAIELAEKVIDSFKDAFEFAEQGAMIERIGEQWAKTAADFGVNAEAVIASMDRAANGTVDDEVLMQTAARAFTQGLVSNVDQMAQFTEIARAAAVRFGLDTETALKKIEVATETGQARGLKGLGIITDFNKAYKELADSRGKEVSDLTDEEKMQARVNEVLTKGAELVAKVGDTSSDAATKFEVFKRQTAEIGDAFKSFAADALAPTINNLDILLTSWQKLDSEMVGHAADVEKTARTYQDYATEIERSGLLTGNLTPILDDNQRALARQALDAGTANGQYVLLNDTLYQVRGNLKVATEDQFNLTHALDAASDSMKIAAESGLDVRNEMAGMAAAQQQAALTASQLKAAQDAMSSTMSTVTDRAIHYQEQGKKLQDLQSKLAELDKEIVARGPQHVELDQKKTLTTDELAAAETKRAKILEDLNVQGKKKNETDIEYAARLAGLKVQLDKLDESEQAHTRTVGGATEQQLKDRDAILEQIKAMELQDNKARAMEGVKALGQALADHKINAEQYTERMTALNQVTGLYSQADLTAATRQQTFLDTLTNTDSTFGDVYKSAVDNATYLNTHYIPAVATTTSTQETHRKKMSEVYDQYGDNTKATDELKVKQDVLASTLKDQVAQAHQDHILKLQAEDSQFGVSRAAVDKYIERLLAIPHDVSTTIHTNYVTSGSPAGGGGGGRGGQYGLDIIVPPNPAGGIGDYFPVLAAPGERVIVQTPQQQAAQPNVMRQGDTYNIVINDRQAMSLWIEELRRRRVSVAEMRM